jgi:hypothetical protein
MSIGMSVLAIWYDDALETVTVVSSSDIWELLKRLATE